MNFTENDLRRLQAKGLIRGYKVVNPPKVAEIEQEAAKRSKFGNRRIVYDGIPFQSVKEGKRYLELMQWQRLGIIHFVNIQVRFKLSVCEYWCDFLYLKDGEVIVEDVKSSFTRQARVYSIKRKLMKKELNITINEH